MMTPVDAVEALGRALGPRAEHGYPLGARTTYRVGGRAALFIEAVNEEELITMARAYGAVSGPVPVLVIGRGSNLLVGEAGFDGLVIALGGAFDTLDIDGAEVWAGAALSLPVLARRTASAGLTGLEWAVGVPGSVGGAVCMNAGGHGSDTAATLTHYRWVDLLDASIHEAPVTELGAAYRHTRVAATDVVVAATHRLAPGDPDQGAKTIAEIVRWRRAHQPGGSNAGSVFVNPKGDSAGRLIEACGLKGFRLGTAEVSPKHANFIQADVGGSADDVRRLMDHVRAVVAARTGELLATEVRMVGFADTAGGAW
jgi:UDP-N-acetylmuramate dehydrogenase